jgi:hypothetical protein
MSKLAHSSDWGVFLRPDGSAFAALFDDKQEGATRIGVPLMLHDAEDAAAAFNAPLRAPKWECDHPACRPDF